MTIQLLKATDLRREKKSQTHAKDVILRLLREVGPLGVTNVKLNEITFRYAARLFELRKEFCIDTKREGVGVFRFTLRGLNKKQQELFPDAAA